MNCPYLTEVTMVFCKASPVKKLVPAGSVTRGSCCEGGEYRGCPLFREAMVHAGQSLAKQAPPPSASPQRPGRRAVSERGACGAAPVDELANRSACGGAAVDELAQIEAETDPTAAQAGKKGAQP